METMDIEQKSDGTYCVMQGTKKVYECKDELDLMIWITSNTFDCLYIWK